MRRALIAVVVACGAPAAPRPPSATPMLPDVPFDKLDRGQRIEFMTERVVPTMRPLFVAHDAAKFAGFGCVTCHGDPARDFAMPNPALPVIDPAVTATLNRADVEFMTTVVQPTMAKLLGVDGLGCRACHPEP